MFIPTDEAEDRRRHLQLYTSKKAFELCRYGPVKICVHTRMIVLCTRQCVRRCTALTVVAATPARLTIIIIILGRVEKRESFEWCSGGVSCCRGECTQLFIVIIRTTCRCEQASREISQEYYKFDLPTVLCITCIYYVSTLRRRCIGFIIRYKMSIIRNFLVRLFLLYIHTSLIVTTSKLYNIMTCMIISHTRTIHEKSPGFLKK